MRRKRRKEHYREGEAGVERGSRKEREERGSGGEEKEWG